MLREHVGRLHLSDGGPPARAHSYLRQRTVVLAAMGIIYFLDVAVTAFVLLAFPGSFAEGNDVSAGIISFGGLLVWVVLKAVLYVVVLGNLTLLYLNVCRNADTGRVSSEVVQFYLLAELILLGTMHIFYGLVLVHNLATVAGGLGS